MANPARDEFCEFDIIRKTKIRNKKLAAQIKYDVNKVTVKILSHIGHVFLPQFDIELLQNPNLHLSFYLRNDGLIWKTYQVLVYHRTKSYNIKTNSNTFAIKK